MDVGTTGAAGGNAGGPWLCGPFRGGLAGLLVALAATGAPGQVTGPAACRAIADDAARLRCYDAAVATATPAQPPVATAPGLRAEDLFGQPGEAARTTATRELGLPDPPSLEAGVAATARNAAGKLVITLDNGQVWSQVDTTVLQLAAGDRVVIRKSALGSYLLQKPAGGRSLRVRRTQ